MTVSHHAHKRFSDKLAFVLDNPIRRRLAPPESLIEKLGIGQNDVVVDFGCGPGFYLIPLAKAASKTIGIDVSSKMLDRAANNAKKARATVELLRGNGASITLPDTSVDLVVLVHVFHEVENKPIVLKEFLRILKPTGRLAIVEKTHPNHILPTAFGPPTLNETELIQEIQQAGFKFLQTIPRGKDSIIICVR